MKSEREKENKVHRVYSKVVSPQSPLAALEKCFVCRTLISCLFFLSGGISKKASTDGIVLFADTFCIVLMPDSLKEQSVLNAILLGLSECLT